MLKHSRGFNVSHLWVSASERLQPGQKKHLPYFQAKFPFSITKPVSCQDQPSTWCWTSWTGSAREPSSGSGTGTSWQLRRQLVRIPSSSEPSTISWWCWSESSCWRRGCLAGRMCDMPSSPRPNSTCTVGFFSNQVKGKEKIELCWNFWTIYGGYEPSRKRVVVPARHAT